jgi:hypothetical protein
MNRVYFKFNYPKTLPNSSESSTVLTGIKRKNKTEYYITGIYVSILPDVTFIYKGTLDGKGKFYTMSFSSTLSIIETNLFGPIEEINENIRVAGTCTIERGIGRDKIRVGCYYEGPLDNSGVWNIIIVPVEKVNDIVAHDTNGGLVVGNYAVSDQWKSYIYEIKNDKFYYITRQDVNNIVTYGILKINKHDYVICGSYILPNTIIEIAYIVDWNNKKKQLSNWRTYSYNNDPEVTVTRFNCITFYHKKYVLTGYYTKNNKTSGFIAYLKNDIRWENIEYPNASLTRGNSIDDNILVGIYDDTSAFISF